MGEIRKNKRLIKESIAAPSKCARCPLIGACVVEFARSRRFAEIAQVEADMFFDRQRQLFVSKEEQEELASLTRESDQKAKKLTDRSTRFWNAAHQLATTAEEHCTGSELAFSMRSPRLVYSTCHNELVPYIWLETCIELPIHKAR